MCDPPNSINGCEEVGGICNKDCTACITGDPCNKHNTDGDACRQATCESSRRIVNCGFDELTGDCSCPSVY